ncbi:hypothetical protein XELAEV_18006374mg [Xenopus laevis]|uniref:Uncharacterized protein n=1 Tax=Xenopus laevis TaxID=8355 RepID=A0A974I418_XENLA|nr:hypothetical protein XELAEV_18006374mg [Xenopus laevis]
MPLLHYIPRPPLQYSSDPDNFTHPRPAHDALLQSNPGSPIGPAALDTLKKV